MNNVEVIIIKISEWWVKVEGKQSLLRLKVQNLCPWKTGGVRSLRPTGL